MNLLAFALFGLLQSASLPPLTGRVVDQASLLTPEERGRLETKLEQLEAGTSVQIVIATIPSLQGESLEDYSIRLAEAWKMGQADLDNGVIVLVARDDLLVRIEVGYGLEAVIPNDLAWRILRERITPSFLANDYYGGLLAAVEGLELAVRREYPEPSGLPQRARAGESGGLRVVGGLVLLVLLGTLGNATHILLAAVIGAIGFPPLFGFIWWSVPLGAALGMAAVWIMRALGRMGSWTSGGGHYGGGGASGNSFGGGGGFGGVGFSGGGGIFGGASGSW